jgi:hypothetical protein
LKLAHLPSKGIGVKAVKTYRDPAPAGNTGSDLGNELHVVHPLLLFGAFSFHIAADPVVLCIEGE